MIPKLKQRLSKYLLFTVASLLIPLIGFFVYASRVQMKFFAVLSFVLLVNLIVLFVFYRRLKLKQAAVKIQREEYFEQTNLLKADLAKEGRTIAAFRAKIVSYSQLKGLLEKLSMCLTFDDTVSALCKEVAGLFDYKDSAVTLYLMDNISGELYIAYALANHRAIQPATGCGDLFDGWVLKSLQALYIQDAKNDFRFDIDRAVAASDRSIRSLISAPLLVHNKSIGILRLDSPAIGRFTEEDLRFLKAIAEVSAVAIENAQLYDKVEDLAIRDSLTGLYLRRYLMERMSEEMSRHSHRKRGLALVILDLDHFKQYNDRFGHPAGDILLKTVGEMLKWHFSAPGCLVCRYGGEEFCVLMPECSKNDAAAKADKFVRLVAKQDIMLRREKTRITLSAGVAVFPEDAKNREGLIQKADAALYEAKNKGRNRVCLSL